MKRTTIASMAVSGLCLGSGFVAVAADEAEPAASPAVARESMRFSVVVAKGGG